VALNRLWQVNWPLDRLAGLGLVLGADVPVFVRGENAWAEGVGEKLTPIALPPAWYVLADPGVHVPTGDLFRSQDLTRNAAPAKIADFVSGNLLDNAFEPVLRRREPAVEAAFSALSRIGPARLTGSGSGCFVEFADRASAEAALRELPGGLRAWLAEGVARSPLHESLTEPA
jgi:4-diphosphocytidyl-2-C-methyl-D-erythritol kinase